MSERRKWIFIYLCPGLHDEHIRWTVIEDEDEAKRLTKGHGFSWPTAGASRGFVRLLRVGDEADAAKVVADYITYLRKLWWEHHPLAGLPIYREDEGSD